MERLISCVNAAIVLAEIMFPYPLRANRRWLPRGLVQAEAAFSSPDAFPCPSPVLLAISERIFE